MVTVNYLCRCLCHWPGDWPGCSEESGYLVPRMGDIVRVEYEGNGTSEECGWLFGTHVLGSTAVCPLGSGWIPACAVVRLRPPGPIKRRAWDGELYSVSQWQEYYGDDLGLLFWEEAEHT